MSFYMELEGEQIKYYSINEIADELNKQRSTITRHLENLREELGDELFRSHLYRGRDPKTKPKKPTTYISEYLYRIVLNHIQLEDDKRYFYMSLPDNRKELKSIIKKQEFENKSSSLRHQHDIPDLRNVEAKMMQGEE